MSLFGKKEAVESGTGRRGYGIAETTLLMRTLPVDQNVELVVRVIRNTLESMNVQLSDIIEDALVKEKGLQDRMDTLKAEIAEFSALIDNRRQEIGRLHDELSETTTVRERLLLAQKQAAEPVAPPPLPRGSNNGKSGAELRGLAT